MFIPAFNHIMHFLKFFFKPIPKLFSKNNIHLDVHLRKIYGSSALNWNKDGNIPLLSVSKLKHRQCHDREDGINNKAISSFFWATVQSKSEGNNPAGRSLVQNTHPEISTRQIPLITCPTNTGQSPLLNPVRQQFDTVSERGNFQTLPWNTMN